MKLPLAIVLALGLGALAACSAVQGRDRTVELPGGVDPEAQARAREGRAPNWLERMFGVSDTRPNVGPCPLTGVVYDNSRLVSFAVPGQERYANIAYTGEMQGIRGLCRYLEDNPITMGIEIDMAFGRGPASTADRQTYRYWVAVARRGRAPIEKEYFDVDVRFARGQSVVTRTEQIGHIVIPRANEEVSGENFEILVGFELTPEQLQFNRDGKRFRVDAGADGDPS